LTWYGHSERVILGGECEYTSAYHHFPDYGVLEIINDQGEAAAAEGECGELVGTGLLNRALPLIRYRTGDRARKLDSACQCGRHFDRFDSVEGRWGQEYLVGKNGSRISLAALNMHGDMFANVVRYQYYQSSPGSMVIRLLVAQDFTPEEARSIELAYARKACGELTVSAQVVPDLPLTGRGKLRRLVQDIPGTGPEG
jgi:phenylacetate-CoA ligase